MRVYSDGRVYGASLAGRLLAHVEHDGDCWLWSGRKDAGGYGLVKVDGRLVGAHRAAYETFVGAIPAGETVDHTCFTSACVNPAHLRLLSWEANAINQRSKLATHCQRGHEFTPDNTWTAPRGGPLGTVRRTCKTCQRWRIAERRKAGAA